MWSIQLCQIRRNLVKISNFWIFPLIWSLPVLLTAQRVSRQLHLLYYLLHLYAAALVHLGVSESSYPVSLRLKVGAGLDYRLNVRSRFFKSSLVNHESSIFYLMDGVGQKTSECLTCSNHSSLYLLESYEIAIFVGKQSKRWL